MCRQALECASISRPDPTLEHGDIIVLRIGATPRWIEHCPLELPHSRQLEVRQKRKYLEQCTRSVLLMLACSKVTTQGPTAGMESCAERMGRASDCFSDAWFSERFRSLGGRAQFTFHAPALSRRSLLITSIEASVGVIGTVQCSGLSYAHVLVCQLRVALSQPCIIPCLDARYPSLSIFGFGIQWK